MRDWTKAPPNYDKMLDRLLALDLNQDERTAFLKFAEAPRLTLRQKAWIAEAYQEHELDADDVENLVSSGQVPRGKPVILPDVLRRLPLKPPGRM